MPYAQKNKDYKEKLTEIDCKIREYKEAIEALEKQRKDIAEKKEQNSILLMMQTMQHDCQSADEMLKTFEKNN